MEIEKSYEMSHSLLKLKEILVDINKYAQYHPLILSCSLIHKVKGNYEEYLIHEKPYLSLPFKINYKVQVSSEGNHVHYTILGIPLAKVSIKYILEDFDEKRTRANFNLKIKGILPFKSILQNKMLDAQDKLMDTIEREVS